MPQTLRKHACGTVGFHTRLWHLPPHRIRVVLSLCYQCEELLQILSSIRISVLFLSSKNAFCALGQPGLGMKGFLHLSLSLAA